MTIDLAMYLKFLKQLILKKKKNPKRFLSKKVDLVV